MGKVLECSSRGDSRFSSFYAKVELNGVTKSIEEHYQKAKRFRDNNKLTIPKDMKDGKGKYPTFVVVKGRMLSVAHLKPYFYALWAKYLNENPELVAFASQYDDFSDMFGTKAICCQADAIRDFIRMGLNGMLGQFKEQITNINSKNFYIEIGSDITKIGTDIIAHQTNTKGVMGSGVAKAIAAATPEVYTLYAELCLQNGNRLLGHMMPVEDTSKGYTVVNMFNQTDYGRDKQYTDIGALERNLIELKKYAKERNYSVAIPYKMGCGTGGGDWNTAEKIVKGVFNDYPIYVCNIDKKTPIPF